MKEPEQPSLWAAFQTVLPARSSEDRPFKLDLQLGARNGITALLGASGSGKTLCLDCLAGFRRPDKGRILLNDRLLFDAQSNIHIPPRKRNCAYIFQDHALFPHLSVRDNLRFPAAVAPSSRSSSLRAHHRINELLQSFELTNLAHRFPAQLSGGEKQRAALARILVNQPSMILLDEPTRGMDERLRQSFYHTLRSVSEQLPVPIMLVSHESEEALAIAEHLLLLADGTVLQSGRTEDVLAQPANAVVAAFLNFHVLLPATILGLDPSRNSSLLQVFGQTIKGQYLPGHLLGDAGCLSIRSSLLTAVPISGSDGEMNGLIVEINRVVPARTGWTIETTEGAYITCQANAFEERPRVGDRVTLYFSKAAVSFLSAK